jgi:hypothetical protein
VASITWPWTGYGKGSGNCKHLVLDIREIQVDMKAAEEACVSSTIAVRSTVSTRATGSSEKTMRGSDRPGWRHQTTR